MPAPLLLLLSLLALALPQPQDRDGNRAALVVSNGDGVVNTQCVNFAEPELTGYELLERSGLPAEIDYQAGGTAVCSIEGTGCPASDCFCECRGSDCEYWSYWHQIGQEWEYSVVGASVYPVRNGAVEGWSWGPGSVTEAIPPPAASFADICGADSASTAGLPATGGSTGSTDEPAASAPLPVVLAGAAVVVLASAGAVLVWRRRGDE